MKYYEINDSIDDTEPEYYQSDLPECKAIAFLEDLCTQKDSPHWVCELDPAEVDDDISLDDLPYITENDSGMVGIKCYQDKETIQYWERLGVLCL